MIDVERLYREAYEAGIRPEPILTISRWADRDRILGTDETAHPGPWRTSEVPYTREIMDALSPSSPVQKVVFQKPARIAGTEIAKNAVGHAVVNAPAGILMVFPDSNAAKAQTKENIRPMFRNTPSLRERMADARARDGKISLEYMEFTGGHLAIVGASNVNALSNRTFRMVFCDQVDDWLEDVQGRGDPLLHAILRVSSYGARQKIYITGPPGILGQSRIHRELLKTDQRRYYLPCPACGHLEYLTWEGKDFFGSAEGLHHSIHYPPGRPELAAMKCAGCGELIEEHHKAWMLEHGVWTPTARPPRQEHLTVGYAINSFYSPSSWLTWGQVAIEFVQRKGNRFALQVWVNQRAGEPWEEREENVREPHELLRPIERGGRVSRYTSDHHRVPNGVGILVAAVDKQKSWLEIVTLGYGAGGESWLIDWTRLEGDTSREPIWLELEEYLRTAFFHESGRALRIEAVAIDARFEPDNVYSFCKAREARRFPDGFEQRVFAVQGNKLVGVPLVGSVSQKNRYNCKVWSLCVHTGKRRIYARLRVAHPGPGFMHLPDWGEGSPLLEYVEGLTAEKLIPRGGQLVWQQVRARNEPLDCNVYALAALEILGDVVIRNLAKRAALFARKPDEPPPAPPGGTPPTAAPRPTRPLTGAPRGGWMSRVKR